MEKAEKESVDVLGHKVKIGNIRNPILRRLIAKSNMVSGYEEYTEYHEHRDQHTDQNGGTHYDTGHYDSWT